MKELYKGIAEVLLNDNDLKSLVGYTMKNRNIRRGYQLEGKWNKLVVFYLQPETIPYEFTSKIRDIPLIVRVYDRESDLNCDDSAERIILLLEGSDLTVVDKVHVYDCKYEGVLISLSYNDNLQSYEKVIRFSIIARMDEIIGNSGAPTRKRKREY